MPTLNVFDNASETRATVLIIDGTRVNDVRVYEDGIVPTVVARYGTGGGNVPMVMKQNAEVIGPLTASGMSRARGTETVESHHYVQKEQTVRRLTPVECERLQGFPDDWTSGQADSSRYKQMGNAVAVPVVEWIVSRMVSELVDE